MSPGGAGLPPGAVDRGPPTDDPLAARLFPSLGVTVRWGLERTARILAAVDNPHRSYPVLHVGGTNGKGSVARIWARILEADGRRVGLYTSPHLVAFRERILVDGSPLPDSLLEDLADELRSPVIRASPSHFEATTALAFLAFARAQVDVVVAEVGLGGRLDATNVVTPVLTAITNVAADHGDMLGDTVARIAAEKAGILKPGVRAYTAARDPDALAVLAEEALVLGTPLVRVAPARGTTGLDGTRCRLRTRRWGELDLRSPLVGAHQLENLALAVRSLEGLPPRLLPGREAVCEGVAAARVPGRMQVEEDPPRRWILDVAHNVAGAHALAATLRAADLARPRVGVIGILADKDWEGMLGILGPELDGLLLTVAPSSPPARRWDPVVAAARVASGAGGAGAGASGGVASGGVASGGGAVGEAAVGEAAVGGGSVEAIPPFDAALARARDLTSGGGTVVVAGSFHTVGGALRDLGRTPREALPLPEGSG